jgi:hypothetical protein
MPNEAIDILRRRTERAYARWRACTSQGPWTEAGDAECRLLKKDLDAASQLLVAARRPSIAPVRDEKAPNAVMEPSRS